MKESRIRISNYRQIWAQLIDTFGPKYCVHRVANFDTKTGIGLHHLPLQIDLIPDLSKIRDEVNLLVLSESTYLLALLGEHMAWIGTSHGIFRLHDSDNWCGSYIELDDAVAILGIPAVQLNAIDKKVIDGASYLSELDLHRALAAGRIASPYWNSSSSFDELVLKKLIELTLPGAIVRQQVSFGRKKVDLQITYKGHSVSVEFVGPSHFIPQYSRPLKSPLERKREVEEHFGHECVIWPYWIQRCTMNVNMLFEPIGQGIASVWSTKAMFGDFIFDDSASIILALTQRFNAIDDQGIGYMYMAEKTNKPIHPIISKISAGTETKARLIPRGNHLAHKFWLPPCLCH